MTSLYTVQTGDTLSGIALSRGVSLTRLLSSNPQITNPNRINPGDRVVIPDGQSVTLSDGGGALPADLFAPYGQWVPFVNRSADDYDLEPALVMAIIMTETNGQNVIGDGGHGRGLMQIDDRAHPTFIATHDAMDPAQNIDYGCSILRSNLNYFQGNLRNAVAAYNAGAGGVEHGIRDAGDPDFYTTHRNGKGYSQLVFENREQFRPFVRPPTFDELEEANPNFRSQLATWQTLRREFGQNPFEWSDFRAHLLAIQAVDPGARPPLGFGGPSGNGSAGPHRPTLEELEQANPNIRSQLANWQEARRQLGQDPFNWSDFRAFQIAINAPDPGHHRALGFGG